MHTAWYSQRPIEILRFAQDDTGEAKDDTGEATWFDWQNVFFEMD